MKIFLDLDGCVTEFVRGAAPLFGKDYDELLASWTPGQWSMSDALGISMDEFLGRLHEAGEEFWINLQPYPGMLDFYNHCCAVAPTYILTAPTRDPRSLSGKLKWIHKWLGKENRNYIMTAKKEMCAQGTHVLIDDHIHNIEKFRDYGGHAILWPSWFNSRFKESHDAVNIVKMELEEIRKKIWES